MFNLLLAAALAISACNSNTGTDSSGQKDPAVMQPPSEAITDSTKLVGDSVIVPDTVANNGNQVGKSDSIQKKVH